MVQGVKDLALSLRQLRSLLQQGFDPWPKNCMLCGKKRKKEKEKSKLGVPTVAQQEQT